MPPARRSLVILAEPGPLLEGLLAIAGALPAGTVVHRQRLADMDFERLGRLQPAVILLDDDAGGGRLAELLGRLRAAVPQGKSLVLAGTVAGQRAALKAGANASLLQGVPGDRLLQTLEGLLTDD
jgi:DNA-binding NarL/FixJ family response regulator